MLTRLLSHFLRHQEGQGLRVLEVGCGTGGNLEMLSRRGDVVALDVSHHALRVCDQQCRLVLGDAQRLPFKPGTFDAIFALDLLEHLENDKDLLHELFRALKDEGCLVLTVPAVKSLWSGHDVALGHFRRYGREELLDKVRDAGFQVTKLTFALSLLFPFIYLFRKAQNLQFRIGRARQHPTGLVQLPRPVNAAFVLFLKLEALLLPWVSLPAGVSLVCIASKHRSRNHA